MNRYVDVLVIGSGMAGLSVALKLADKYKVVVVTKADILDTNTNFAQGGIAAVTYVPDTFDKHVADTLSAGSYLNNENIVRKVVENGPSQIKELIHWGVKFDRDKGRYDLAREGGHHEHRILHHKDNTGNEIQRALATKAKSHPNIDILEHHFAVEILTQHHKGKLVKKSSTDTECYGAYVVNLKNKSVYTFLSKVTIIATGGIGNIYHTTTNPIVSTGDGIAMVHRAKGKVESMEFIQFHPTSLYNPGERPSFLITEALRGFGAVLRTRNRQEFMQKYHEMGSLAPRDVVARSIDNELKISGDEYLYLDVTHKDAQEIIAHFPNIYNKCLTIGIDITKDMIPIVPAAHYCCGGITVDENSQSSISRLYAIGEASNTGLHGANRLASNSLLEAIVFAQAAEDHIVQNINKYKIEKDIPDWDYKGTSHPEEYVLITQNYKEMQQLMSNYVGIVRSNIRLERALKRLEIIYQETEELYKKSTMSQSLCELRNMIAVGYIIIRNAQEMKQSVGLHYTIDYQ
ncbi:MAG: L-aspartate oxidase [Rikenellaceae bacterium]